MDTRSRNAAIGLSALACPSTLMGLGKLAAFDAALGPRTATRPGLLFFPRPSYPSTCASIGEPESIAAFQGANAATITFVEYRVVCGFEWDDGGREARRFIARSSGSVLVYRSGGSLFFSGGVAPDKLDGILTGPTTTPSSPVIVPGVGCALDSQSQADEVGL